MSFNQRRVNVDGVEPPPGRDSYSIDAVGVDGGYFDAAGVPLVRGPRLRPRGHGRRRAVVMRQPGDAGALLAR